MNHLLFLTECFIISSNKLVDDTGNTKLSRRSGFFRIVKNMRVILTNSTCGIIISVYFAVKHGESIMVVVLTINNKYSVPD